MTDTNAIGRAAASASTGTNDLRDIKPPVEIPTGWAWVLWLLAALAAAAVLAWAWRRWRKRLTEPPVVPVVPPHIRAKQRLLEALALLDQPRQFCIAVSDTLRLYLEERFDFHAPERTTEEFLIELRQTNRLNPAQKERLGEFLTRCDLVKFARYEPAVAELRDLHACALGLVEETEPREQPPSEPSAGSGELSPETAARHE
jgi:hypothetical protein